MLKASHDEQCVPKNSEETGQLMTNKEVTNLKLSVADDRYVMSLQTEKKKKIQLNNGPERCI